MASRVVLSGVDELIAELQRLPAHLRDEGNGILAASARRTRDLVSGAYKVITGTLAGSVKIVGVSSSSPYRLRARVESQAPYARFYEFGTARQPSRPTFVPIAQREQTSAMKKIVALVRSTGLEVTGDRGR